MLPMKLEEWMREQDVDDDGLAAQLGVDRTTVSRIRRGRQKPSWDLVGRIVTTTGGAVKADDFLARCGPAGYEAA
jgi:DNA-binding XRE family transcriptional regulator